MTNDRTPDIDDLLGLMPDEGVPWIRLGALAWHESAKSGVVITCPYAEQSEESAYWHMGYIGAQVLPSCQVYIERMRANEHRAHPHKF